MILERSCDFYTEDFEPVIMERDGQEYIAGYAALAYDGTPKTEYYLGRDKAGYQVYERFAPEAFTNWKQNTPVECWYDHNPKDVLGVQPDSLELDMSAKGCFYRSPFDPQDPDHVKVRSKFNRKLVRGSSIGFGPLAERTTFEGKKKIITVTRFWIRDVGPVPRPAYTGASAMIRSANEKALACWDQWEETKLRREFLKTLHR